MSINGIGRIVEGMPEKERRDFLYMAIAKNEQLRATGWRLLLGWFVIAILIVAFSIGMGQCHRDMRERFGIAESQR